ncbi:MAG: ABC transporter ATP-binding protein, partial [Verrucomicrobiales bacterium]|nr:ABC transporter ATP-binding protein [Verrucomicrobiales bacterium]
ERLVQAALEKLMEGRTTFVIAHRLNTVRKADRILVLRGGRVVESGTHDELTAMDGFYRYLCEEQLGGG